MGIISASRDSKVESKYLLSSVAKNNYAFELNYIKEIVITPAITQIPKQPVHQKGIINLRRDIIPLFDLRTILGYMSSEEELKGFLSMLRQREQDHIDWLDELHASITEKREFRKTTDPHACAFGKWYDNYKTDNIKLAMFLRAFDEPHKNIHKSAIEIQKIIVENGYDEALEHYRKIKEIELTKMIKLFSELYTRIEAALKSYSVIVNHNNSYRGYIVDEVERISTINDDIYLLEDLKDSSDYIKGIIREDDNDYMVIDFNKLAG